MNAFSKVVSLLIFVATDLTNGFTFSSRLSCRSSSSVQWGSVNDNNNNYNLIATTESASQYGKVAPMLRSALALLIAVPTLTQTVNSRAMAAAPSEEKYLDALATLITCKKVLETVDQYIEVQAYDSARTNVNYLLNQLFLEKKVQMLIQQSLDFSEDSDAVDVAQEAGNRVSNTAIQLDSTLYTCVFIPSDDGTVPPAAEKYRKQCFDFLKVTTSCLSHSSYRSMDSIRHTATSETALTRCMNAFPALRCSVIFQSASSEKEEFLPSHMHNSHLTLTLSFNMPASRLHSSLLCLHLRH
jgi:hypothetical protein